MFIMQNASCEFSLYARGLDLSLPEDQKALATALNTSFNFISSCSNGNSNFNHEQVVKLRKIIFDAKIHTLTFKPLPSAFSPWFISKIWTASANPEEMSGPKNLEGMMLFVAEKLSKLAKLKLGPSDEDIFSKYLLMNYNNIHMGIYYLKEYYRLFVSKIEGDPEEKTLGRCLQIHETITSLVGQVAGYDRETIVKLLPLFPVFKGDDLLLLEIYTPIRKMMSLSGEQHGKKYIEEVFKKGKHFKFMIDCLKIDTELLPHVLGPLYDALEQAHKNWFKPSNPYLQDFYSQILNSNYFQDLHLDAVIQLLMEKRWDESDDEFQIRSQSKPVKEALDYVCRMIEQIKKQPVENQKKQLTSLLEAILPLDKYPPFKQIFDFALVYSNQIPTDHNPGLPFKQLGGHHITTIVIQILLSFDDIETVDLFNSSCRKKLLECAETIITKKFLDALQSNDYALFIDIDKLKNWLGLFPEVCQLSCWPLIEKFCELNNISNMFQKSDLD